MSAIVRHAGRRYLGTYYTRPELKWGDVWCNRCNKPCDFAETAAHNNANPGRSRMYIHAACHGEEIDILMTFQQWADSKQKRIVAFESVALPEPLLKLPPQMPLLLMDKVS